MAKYIFAQLVDLSYVRYLLESHHSLTGMVYGVFDSEENNLIAVGGRDVTALEDAEQRLSRFVANAPGFFYTLLLRDSFGWFWEMG
jgi:hypothetical protein